MQRKFKKAFNNIKEHGSVSYAKIMAMGGFHELDLIIIKATSTEDLPLDDRYVHDLLKTFTTSPSNFRAFSLIFNRRFGKTKCWRVALKCLALLHRLIRSLPYDGKIKEEIVWARCAGLLSIDPCYFRDSSSSCSEYYTVFIRSYARLVNEAMDRLLIEINKMDEELEEVDDVNLTVSEKMIEVERLLVLLPQLQNLIDRVIDCRPRGPAERNFLVQSAMKHIIRDSFISYKNFRRNIEILLERLMQMPYRSGVAAFSIYKKSSTQANELNEFYDWCKSLNLCGPYEYPIVDKIPNIQIQALETFLKRLWQSSEFSSSSGRTSFYSLDDDNENNKNTKKEIVSGVAEMEPLIKFDVSENDDNWEALLESSISPNKNQFNQPYTLSSFDVSIVTYPDYPWGL